MHVKDSSKYPTPADLEVGLVLGLGFPLLLAMNFPWSKIRVGDVEIERAIQDQIDSSAMDSAELEKVISNLEEQLKSLGDGTTESTEVLEEVEELRAKRNKEDTLIEEFLSNWHTWGFTPGRIANWGSKQKGFEAIADLDASANRLVAQGKAKI